MARLTLLKIRHPLPTAWTCDCLEPEPRTQHLRPALYVNQNVFFAPLTRGLMVEAKIPNATAAEINNEIEAMSRAAEHGRGPSGSRDPKAFLSGYSPAGLMVLLERARKKLRLKPKNLQGNKKKAAKERHKRWETRADEIWSRQPDLSKREVAKQIADEEDHGHWTWIERIIVKK